MRRARLLAALLIVASLLLLFRQGPDPPNEPAAPAPNEGSWATVGCWFDEGWFSASACAWLWPSLQDADTRTALPVVRLQRSVFGPSRRATVYLSGGPGGNSYLYREGVDMWRDWMDRLALDHDLILYDQRGTGYAEPSLPCPALDEASRAMLDQDLDPDAQFEQLEPLLVACAEQVDPADRARGLYSTASAAQDLRELVAALEREWGYGEISVYGVSYGTRLAAEAFQTTNDGVDRIVLDSFYPAGVDLMLTFPATFAQQLFVFEARCRARADRCGLDAQPLRALLGEALAAANSHPGRIEVDDPLTGQRQAVRIDASTLFGMVEHVLYADAESEALPLRLREFIAGDLGEAWTAIVVDWLWAEYDPEFSLLAHVLIECRDTPPSRVEDELAVLQPHPDWIAALRRAPASFGLCERLGVTPEPLHRRASALPTLLIAAELDPRTPSDIALAASGGFAQLTRLVLPIAGHSVVDFDDCAATAAGAFLNRGDTEPARRCAPDTGTPAP